MLKNLTLKPWHRYTVLMMIPLIWLWIDRPWVTFREHPLAGLISVGMNTCYQVRGEKPAKNPQTGESLKLIYVDVDSQAVSKLGERPWNRRVYADVASALIQLGGVRSVGYDFVLSPLTTTDMVPQENINTSNISMADVMLQFPDKIVLAGSYTGATIHEYMDQPAMFPLFYRGATDSKKNALPEMPMPPIIDLVNDTNEKLVLTGTIGLINIDAGKDKSIIPNWVPMYSLYEGQNYTKGCALSKIRQFSTIPDIKLKLALTDNLWEIQTEDGIMMASYPRQHRLKLHAISLEMLRQYYRLPPSSIQIEDTVIKLVNENGKSLHTMPLENNQLMEINWFSKWLSKENPRYSVQYIRDLWTCFLAATGIPYNGQGREHLSVLNVILNKAMSVNDPRVDDMVGFYQIWGLSKNEEDWNAFKNHSNNQDFFAKHKKYVTAERELVRALAYRDMLTIALKIGVDEASWTSFRKSEEAKSIFSYYPDIAKNILNMKAEEATTEIFAVFQDFRDALILVGPVDNILQDLAPSPFDNDAVPKVGVHGNMIKTIFSGAYIQRLDWQISALITILMGVLAGITGFYGGAYGGVIRGFCGTILVCYLVAIFVAFSNWNFVLPFVVPAGSAFSTGLVGLMWRVVLSEKQKGRIKGMFGTYLSPTLVNKMVDSGEEPQLGGVEAKITAFFSDVQGFSGFSEQLTPPQLVKLMNEYLSAMTDLLMIHECYVDKYIGDAIVGIFNAPITVENHALKACIVTQQMHLKLGELRKKWESEGDTWPPIVSKMQMRIGLNTGTATVGNMGSEKRFNYTMMGDTVNLAARCESGAKAYGVYTMITGETMRAAQSSGDDCVFRFLDKIVVKGRSEPAEMYEIVCLKQNLTEETKACIEHYNQGTAHYLKQEWSAATAEFKESAKREPNRKELNPLAPPTPSEVMLERVQYMIAHPPVENWDGVYVMKSK